MKVRVGVVGGGIIGACAVYFLQRQGHDVVLFEETQLAGGSTGLSVGEVEAQYFDRDGVARRVFSLRFFETLEEEIGRQLIHRNGYLRLGRSAEAMTDFATSVRLQDEMGWSGARVLDAAQVCDLVPGLLPTGLHGGLLGSRDGYVDPAEATTLVVDRAREMGATVQLGRKVTRIEVADKTVLLSAQGDEYAFDVVVNAAGANAGHLRSHYADGEGFRNERHEICILSIPEDYPDIPFTMDYIPGSEVPGIYFRLDAPGQMLVGLHDEGNPSSAVTGDDWERGLSASGRVAIVARFLEVLPDLGQRSAVAGGWAGLYPFAGDGLPRVGWSVAGRVLEAVGFGGVGVQLGPWAGSEVARQVSAAYL